jgi:cysteinyl-tRNA synthetase
MVIQGEKMSEEETKEELNDRIIKMEIALRAQAKSRGDFAFADYIRDALAKLGIILEDTKDGTTWRWQ